jgi:putative transposase
MRKHYTAQFKAQVVQEILKEEKSLNQLATEHGIHPNQLKRWKAMALEGLPSLFSKTDQAVQTAAEHERQVTELYAEIGRLTTELTWLKKKLASLPRADRLALLEREPAELPLTTQAALLELNRSGLYYVPRPVTSEEVIIKHAIDEIYTAYPFYGSRRITVELRENRKLLVARETVQRYMREMGITAIYPGPHLSRHNPEHKVYPYLLRHVTAAYPNHVWGIDITYIRLRSGWLYLVAVIDWFSRYVVSWELDQTLEMPFVVTAVERALAQATPLIWNSDQGSHFTSPQYTQLLLDAGVQISMDGKGRASDNSFTERLWRTVKYEEVYLQGYDNPRTARQSLTAYFDFYDRQRFHQALNYRTPAAVYFASPTGAQRTLAQELVTGEPM